MLPGKAAKKNRDLVPFFGCESAFHGAVEVGGPVQPGDLAQSNAFSFEALLNLYIIFNLDELRRHVFLRHMWMFGMALRSGTRRNYLWPTDDGWQQTSGLGSFGSVGDSSAPKKL